MKKLLLLTCFVLVSSAFADEDSRRPGHCDSMSYPEYVGAARMFCSQKFKTDEDARLVAHEAIQCIQWDLNLNKIALENAKKMLTDIYTVSRAEKRIAQSEQNIIELQQAIDVVKSECK
jgi:hypothetical protein